MKKVWDNSEITAIGDIQLLPPILKNVHQQVLQIN